MNMAMKNHKYKVKKIDPVIYYKWEFLRRWEKYKNDYANKATLPKDIWRRKYGMLWPLDPAWELKNRPKGSKMPVGKFGFEENLKITSPAVVVEGIEHGVLNEDDVGHEHNLDMAYELPGDIITEQFVLKLKIDLNKPSEEIHKELKTRINAWKHRIGIEHRNRYRKRLKDYKQYLRTYDLKTEKGWSLGKIATKLHNGDMRKTCRHIKKCKQLIRGGYKKIDI